jgi:hypothetical protein
MGKQQYVVIREMSAGNGAVGEMWKETKIFNGNSALDDVMNWALGMDYGKDYSRKQITITKPHPDKRDVTKGWYCFLKKKDKNN